MKLIDIINRLDTTTMVVAQIEAYGIKFKAEYYPEYYLSQSDELLEKEVIALYVSEDKLHLNLN